MSGSNIVMPRMNSAIRSLVWVEINGEGALQDAVGFHGAGMHDFQHIDLIEDLFS
jgi:hypothetical protein